MNGSSRISAQMRSAQVHSILKHLFSFNMMQD